MKKFFLLIVLIILSNLVHIFSLNEIDSLTQLLSKKSEYDKPDLLIELASKYWFSNPQNSFKYGREALSISLKNKSVKNEAVSLYSIGISQLIINNNDSSLFYLNKSLILFKQLNDTLKIANNYRALADVYSELADDNTAQENYLKSYNIFETIVSKPNLSKIENNLYAILLNNLGSFYVNIENYSEAIKYFDQSLVYYEAIKNKQGLSIAYFNIGLCWKKLKIKEKSVENFNKAFKIALEENNLTIQSNVLQEYGDLSMDAGDFSKALIYLDKALELMIKTQNKFLITSNYTSRGLIYLKTKEYSKSISNFQTALKFAIESTYFNKIIEVYKYMSDVYKETNDYKKSNEYLNKYVNLKDSLFSIEKTNKINQLDKKFNLDKKEKENEKLRHLNEEEKFHNDRLWLIILSLIFVISLAIITLIVLRNRNLTRERLNKILNYKNELINSKNEELETANSTKDMFFSIIAHDLKNPIGNFKQVTEILAESNSEISESERIEFLHLMKTSANNIYELLENLLEWSSSQKNLITFNPEITDLYLLANENIKMFELAADYKKIKIINNVEKNSNIAVDHNMIKTVIRNLVSNAIKFTPESGIITLKSSIENNSILISISDTGVGMPIEVQNKLFKIEKKMTSLGTNQEVGTGLGLILCKDFIEMHNGKIWVKSDVSKGSTFTFSLPF